MDEYSKSKGSTIKLIKLHKFNSITKWTFGNMCSHLGLHRTSCGARSRSKQEQRDGDQVKDWEAGMKGLQGEGGGVWYQGHTNNPNSSSRQKHQPYVFFGNTWLGFHMAGATGVAGRRRVACNQQLQPSEIPAMYSRRIRRAGVSSWAYRCGPGMSVKGWGARWRRPAAAKVTKSQPAQADMTGNGSK